jgi:Spy/CpxP family protein refolding chaperone
MIDRRLAAGLLVLLLVPSALTAQRRSKERDTKPNWDNVTKRDAEPTILTRKEVEAMDPVRELLARRKDLKLTDEQSAKLKAMDDSGRVRDVALFETMDSLRKELRPAANAGQSDDMARLRRQVVQREFAATVVKIRANYHAALEAALPVLDETQRPKADALLAKQQAESDEIVLEKLGGRGGGGPPRRP